MKILVFVFTLVLFAPLVSHAQTSNAGSIDYVPDEKTAIKIAEAVWLAKYGKRIYKKRPFTATLIDSTIWSVKGTLHHGKGGVPHAKIQKSDGKIFGIYYDK